jgi:hypothetical protein
MALSLDQFCMRNGLVIGALVVSHYVRAVYPYERAHEKGMGIVQDELMPSSSHSVVPVTPEDLEARLLAEELRSIKEAPRGGRSRAGTASGEAELEELSGDEFLVDDDDPLEPRNGAPPFAGSGPTDHLGLDAFDEDSEVKPVVLLSPKRKVQERKADGNFMSDLERRLLEDSVPAPDTGSGNSGSGSTT